MSTQHRIYVASSWRNTEQPAVVAALRADGHEVYDFKNPAIDDQGFSWRQIPGPPREEWTAEHFGRIVLDHPVAERGFNFDMNALEAASACVIVLPCGRSAHLEHGYAVGSGKLTIVYQPTLDEPELMYRMCDYYESTLDGVRLALSRARPRPRWQRDLAKFDARGVRGREYEGQWPCALTASVYRPPAENAGLPERGPCREYHHRECRVCGGCWRHGACTCGPLDLRMAKATPEGK